MAMHTASGNDVCRRKLVDGANHDFGDRPYTLSPSSNQCLNIPANKGDMADGHGKTDRSLARRDDDQSQEGLLKAITYETEDLLRTPLTALSSDLISEAGFPSGVERARTEYAQGLLSTGTFFRDCLPPALLRCKKNTESHGLEPSRKSLSVPQQCKQYQNDGLNAVVRPRNLSKEEQFKRINQAPLSAIYEESDPWPDPQGECPCNVCKNRINGQRIVWFHLCPRYKALALQNGIKYEPYEGRVIMHHGHDRSSLGLIIEGPMEDRFVPAVEPSAEPTTTVPKPAKAPKPGKHDRPSLHSAGGCEMKITPSTNSSSKLPPVSTPALQRPISPTTVSQPSSLIPLPTILCPKATKSKGDNRPPCTGVIDSQENIHPAFRVGEVLPEEWTTPPTRSQSAASTRDDSPQRPHSIRSEKVRLSVGASEDSGELPARTDSLGAPTHPDIFQPSDKHHVHQHVAHDLPIEQTPASAIADYAFSPPLLSPSAGHERTPSEYLCPSTPSTTSNQRSSASSDGDSSPPNLCQERGAAAAVTPKAGDDAPSTKDPLEHNDHQQGQQPVTPQPSYYTAPSSALASSCCLPTPATAHATSSSPEGLCRNNPSPKPSYFRSRGYHRSQVSQQSATRSLNSLPFQRNSGFTSSTTLLNGSAFKIADETSCSEAEEGRHRSSERHSQNGLLDWRNKRNIFTKDSLVTAGAAQSRRPDILASSRDVHYISNDGNGNGNSNSIVRPNILMTVGATETHCTNIVTAAPNPRHVSRRASVPVGQGIADSLASPHSSAPSRINHQSSTPSPSSSSSSSSS
ncbi:MAG: hypothetical protein Q9211_003535, partial [Gyalolechia sp. 1 TL-2023]